MSNALNCYVCDSDYNIKYEATPQVQLFNRIGGYLPYDFGQTSEDNGLGNDCGSVAMHILVDNTDPLPVDPYNTHTRPVVTIPVDQRNVLKVDPLFFKVHFTNPNEHPIYGDACVIPLYKKYLSSDTFEVWPEEEFILYSVLNPNLDYVHWFPNASDCSPNNAEWEFEMYRQGAFNQSPAPWMSIADCPYKGRMDGFDATIGPINIPLATTKDALDIWTLHILIMTSTYEEIDTSYYLRNADGSYVYDEKYNKVIVSDSMYTNKYHIYSIVLETVCDEDNYNDYNNTHPTIPETDIWPVDTTFIDYLTADYKTLLARNNCISFKVPEMSPDLHNVHFRITASKDGKIISQKDTVNNTSEFTLGKQTFPSAGVDNTVSGETVYVFVDTGITTPVDIRIDVGVNT